MKKFYTFALAATVALAATAEGRRAASTQKSIVKNITIEQAEKISFDANKAIKPRRAPMKSIAVDDYVGDADWNYEWLLNSDPTVFTTNIEIIDAAKGEVAIDLYGFTVKGIFDVNAGTLSIPNNQYLGKDNYGDDLYFYVAGFDDEGYRIPGAADIDATVGTIDGNYIDFSTYDLWALGDPNNEQLGWYALTYANSFDFTKWESIGDVIISGDFFLSTFGVTPTNYSASAQLNEDGTLIRIKDALNLLYAAAGAADYESPSIVFDVTNHDNVILNFFDSGLGNQTAGSYCMFSYSFLSDEVGDQVVKISTEDGKSVITCAPMSLYMYTSTTKQILPGNQSEAATITLSKDLSDALGGVDSVAADNAAAPVEYYNIQGQRIANPTAGQLVIRKQGTKVEKLIIR